MGKKGTSIPNTAELKLIEEKKVDIHFVKSHIKKNPNGIGFQIKLWEQTIGTAKNEEEINACLKALVNCLNSTNPFIKIQELRVKVNGANMASLIPDVPPLRYDNSPYGQHAIVNEKTNELVLPFTASEILDLALKLNDGWSALRIDTAFKINGYYQFYHQDECNLMYIQQFEKLFFKGELNDIIQRIHYLGCREGYIDYNIGIVFPQRQLKDYLPEEESL